MAIRKNSPIQLPRHALSRATLAGVAAIALAGLATGCSPTTSTASAHGTASSATPAAPVSTAASTPASATPAASPAATAQPTATASAQPTGSAGTQAVLSPATVPPVDKECTYPVSRTADGNATPLLCQDGRLNVDAWDFYYTSFASSELLRLGQERHRRDGVPGHVPRHRGSAHDEARGREHRGDRPGVLRLGPERERPERAVDGRGVPKFLMLARNSARGGPCGRRAVARPLSRGPFPHAALVPERVLCIAW